MQKTSNWLHLQWPAVKVPSGWTWEQLDGSSREHGMGARREVMVFLQEKSSE